MVQSLEESKTPRQARAQPAPRTAEHFYHNCASFVKLKLPVREIGGKPGQLPSPGIEAQASAEKPE